jgi:Domain of unknown function (DUF4365)
MKFPKRIDKHQTEAASWRLLHQFAPEQWIVRELTERDYGIDSYIEITSDSGHVTGNLISVQLKGTDSLTWKEEGSHKKARSPQIKTTTANYWFNLPVPVFLFVAELSTGKVFYTSVEPEIRKNFDLISKQDTLTFPLHDELNLNSASGINLFNWFLARERIHDHFAFHITNLLSQATSFSEFIQYNQNRDSFMEVEAERHLQFRAIYECCRIASLYIENEWKITSLRDLYESDRTQWQDEFVPLHEGTLDHALRQIEKIFVPLARKALKRVSETEAQYWRRRDPVFYRLCSSGEMDLALQNIEQQIANDGQR